MNLKIEIYLVYYVKIKTLTRKIMKLNEIKFESTTT